MSGPSLSLRGWNLVGLRFLPVAEAVSAELPLRRLLRLALFQVSVGMCVALVVGTLNRVMIVELGVSARLVAVVVALPLVFAPARALIGFRSDTHRSALGWRRVPYLWIGTMLQFGGLAVMPFALLLLGEGGHAPAAAGPLAAGLAFLLVGAGLHTVQTVGLALATDLAPERSRPQVVTVLCVMLLVGVLAGAAAFGLLLASFSEKRLIQVVQGAAAATVLLNGVALWKQEPLRRGAAPAVATAARPRFRDAWRALRRERQAGRRLVVVGLGTVAFSLQDVLLEPYGGAVLRLPVGVTAALTGLLAAGGLAGFALAGTLLARTVDRYRVAAIGVLAGLGGFVSVAGSAPVQSGGLFAGGTALIGLGAAMFAVGTLSGALETGRGSAGLALGVWGAVQAFAAGSAIAAGGLLCDGVGALAGRGALGPGLAGPAVGYEAVYCLELVLLFATLVALGPLVRFTALATLAPAPFERIPS